MSHIAAIILVLFTGASSGFKRSANGRYSGRSVLQALSSDKMGIGTWAWGDKTFWGYNSSQDESLQAAFIECQTSGVTLFDTAELYGFGRSELLLGRFDRQTTPPKNAFFATKFAPYPFRFSKEDVVEAARESADRLGIRLICTRSIGLCRLTMKPIGRVWLNATIKGS
jgi:aryl-alcohol dehydrogenase-like predicted oxidoreductase